MSSGKYGSILGCRWIDRLTGFTLTRQVRSTAWSQTAATYHWRCFTLATPEALVCGVQRQFMKAISFANTSGRYWWASRLPTCVRGSVGLSSLPTILRHLPAFTTLLIALRHRRSTKQLHDRTTPTSLSSRLSASLLML